MSRNVMKICYLANAQSIHTQRWAKHFQKRGHEVTIISFQYGEVEGIHTICLSSDVLVSPFRIVKMLPKVQRMVKGINPDILHAHYATSYGLAGALAGKHPFVITAWGSDVLIEPEKSWIYRLMVRFSMSRADLITSMAQHMTAHLIKRKYAAANKIITLPFGVDTEVFNLGRRANRQASRKGKRLVVISTRHLEHGYDVDIFIRAIPKVLDSCKNVRFVVVGDGSLRGKFEKMVASLGVNMYVEFLGKIPHHEMPDVLACADIFVTTSPSDGNNVSLNEAMACGVFPVATDIAANRAWIEHRRNGLLFACRDVDQLAEMITEAIRHPEWRERTMDINWQIIQKRASWPLSMAEMERRYLGLLREEKPKKRGGSGRNYADGCSNRGECS